VGLLEELGYTRKPPDRLQRTLQRAAARERVSSTLQKTLYPLDKTLHRASGGRHTVASLLTGIPVIMLTTTGARTGNARSTPLIGIPMEDHLATIGSNYGTRSTPGWVYNLEANPGAVVAYRDRRVAVMARRATDHETNRAFDAAAAIYAAFPAYRNRAAHREIRVFVLETAT
jgi:deazaflavin-dependent oxidoreductase (nitroreductase family)